MLDWLSPQAVQPLLRGSFGRRRYVYRESCPSTQGLLDVRDPEGAVAVTEEQTEGRGRLGRSWLAPPRSSVLCSVLLRPVVATERLPELSLVAGRAVAAAIRVHTGLEPELKFPNDVLVGGRKAAGILAEAREGIVVLGLGVNVSQRTNDLPPDAGATSLALELGRPVERAQLLAEILGQLEDAYAAWNRTAEPS